MLTRHFLQQSAAQLGVEPKRISEAALVWLGQFAFPGNVRQLENMCHWVTVMAPAQVIEPKDLPPEIGVKDGVGGEVPMMMPVVTSYLPDARSQFTSGAAQAVDLPVDFAPSAGLPTMPVLPPADGWELGLEAAALALLATGRTDVWDELTRRFESRLITAALAATRGRRIEAAQKLGIGRNTITRKIQELGLE